MPSRTETGWEGADARRAIDSAANELLASIAAEPGMCNVPGVFPEHGPGEPSGSPPAANRGFRGPMSAGLIPRVAAVHELVERLRRLIFVGYFDRHPQRYDADGLRGHVQDLVAAVRANVLEQAHAEFAHVRALAPEGAGAPPADPALRAAALADSFLARLAHLRGRLALDVAAAFEGDPAARSIEEVIVCYPGVDAVFCHRVAHELWMLGATMVARIVAELAHSRTGIDIHPGATIGARFFIDHGTGVVIGETAEIGDDVKIYQGVTLGAKSFPRDESGRLARGVKRHPTIGSRVTIYADAVILGGDTHIGDDCVINGSVFLSQSVPAGHIVRAKQPELVLRENRERRG